LVNDLASLDVLNNFFICLTIERKATHQHEIKNDSDTPHVDLVSIFIFEDFRCAIKRSMKTATILRNSLKSFGTSDIKINESDVSLSSLLEEDISTSDIAMH
jgi:hypothetical protein